MTLWLDAQISPFIAVTLSEMLEMEVVHVRDLGLRDSEDSQIFFRARRLGAIVLTKDSDFVDLVNRTGPPPQIVYLRCGNCSNKALIALLDLTLKAGIDRIKDGDSIVEIR